MGVDDGPERLVVPRVDGGADRLLRPDLVPLSHRVVEEVRSHFGNKVFNTVIPRNVRISESPSHGLPIILYDVKSRGAVAYMDLAHEILYDGRA